MAKILLGEILRELEYIKEYPNEPPYDTSDCPHDSTWLDGWDSAVDKAIEIVKRRYDYVPYSE